MWWQSEKQLDRCLALSKSPHPSIREQGLVFLKNFLKNDTQTKKLDTCSGSRISDILFPIASSDHGLESRLAKECLSVLSKIVPAAVQQIDSIREEVLTRYNKSYTIIYKHCYSSNYAGNSVIKSLSISNHTTGKCSWYMNNDIISIQSEYEKELVRQVFCPVARSNESQAHLAKECLKLLTQEELTKKPKISKGESMGSTTVCDVEICHVPAESLSDGSTRTYKKCNFCEKETVLSASDPLLEKLSGPGRFYCSFCLRNGYNHRSGRNILIMSFRGILGYYYWALYAFKVSPSLFVSQIEDYARFHEEVGLRNPVFRYDSSTFLWFLDFSRIGSSRRKVPLSDILGTVVEILASFDLFTNVPGITPHKIYLKYDDAIRDFHTIRQRPHNKKILSPTLLGCGIKETVIHSNSTSGKSITIASTRDFLPSRLKIYKKY